MSTTITNGPKFWIGESVTWTDPDGGAQSTWRVYAIRNEGTDDEPKWTYKLADEDTSWNEAYEHELRTTP